MGRYLALIADGLRDVADNHALVGVDQIGRGVQAPHVFRARRVCQLDLNGPALSGHVEHQVQLPAPAGAKPEGLEWHTESGELANGLLDDVALPARADPGLAQQGALVGHVEQRVHQPRVSPQHLGPLDEPLAQVGQKGRQATDQERPFETVEVAVDRVVRQPEAGADLAGVPALTV